MDQHNIYLWWDGGRQPAGTYPFNFILTVKLMLAGPREEIADSSPPPESSEDHGGDRWKRFARNQLGNGDGSRFRVPGPVKAAAAATLNTADDFTEVVLRIRMCELKDEHSLPYLPEENIEDICPHFRDKCPVHWDDLQV